MRPRYGARRARLNLRSQQKAERRSRILDAAREIIAMRGYETLTMRELARVARVTVPTIYNLIGSKDEVVRAAVQEQTAQFIRGIESSPRETPASRMLSVVNLCIDELLRQPGYYRSLLQLFFSAEGGEGLRDSVTRSISEQFERALLEMAEADELASWTDVHALADRLGSHVRITTIEWADGSLDAEQLRASTLYGSCLLLLGASRGRSAEEIKRCLLRSQPAARPSEHTDGGRHDTSVRASHLRDR
jgi:AcrR family transcriptional regulator